MLSRCRFGFHRVAPSQWMPRRGHVINKDWDPDKTGESVDLDASKTVLPEGSLMQEDGDYSLYHEGDRWLNFAAEIRRQQFERDLADARRFAPPRVPKPEELATEEPELDQLFIQVDIETRAHDKAVLKSYETFATSAAKHLAITVSDAWEPQYIWWVKTVLKSPFVKAKYRTQFETRTYFRSWRIQFVTGSTLSTYLEYIQRNLPEGVAMKVTKTEMQPLPRHLTKQPSLKDVSDEKTE